MVLSDQRTKPAISDGADPPAWWIIRRLLGLSWRYRHRCAAVVVMHGLTLVAGLGTLSLTGLGVDAIRHAADPTAAAPNYRFGLEPPAEWSAYRAVVVIACAILVMGVLHAVLRFGSVVSQSRLVQGLIVDLRSMVYDKLQRLSFRFFDKTESASIINRVASDVQAVRLFVDGVLIEALQLVLWVGIYFCYMLSIHVRLTLACMATLPVLWVVAVRHSRVVRPAHRKNRELVDRMVRVVSENLRGVRVVKGFAREEQEVGKFRLASHAVRDQKHWIFGRISRFVPGVTLLTHVSEAVLLGYGGYLVVQNELRLGEGLIVFAAILQQFSTRVSSIAMITNSIQRSLTGAARVFEVLDEPVEVRSPVDPVALPVVCGGGADSVGFGVGLAVGFEGVRFSYGGGVDVLREVTFDVPAGECVALLGPNGSGKSTVMSLVPRFYDVGAGRVTVGGVDVRSLDLDELRRRIGIVFQENFLFSNSVAANIAFGDPGASREQVERAARVAAADGFIRELPRGYDTVIGEDGVDLSGGQRQRLALARAVLMDPPVLLLDDPTAAVDPQTESVILDALDRVMAHRTTLMVAHRVSTLSRADRVVVLERGRVSHEGTHEQLMGESEHYREVVRLQGASGGGGVDGAGVGSGAEGGGFGIDDGGGL